MRVTSEFFVSALIRRHFTEGGFAALRRKGAPEAGAIFIVVDRLDGSSDFYGPAPQAMFVETPDGRLFEKLLSEVQSDEIAARLEREARMDPDFWVVDIEARDGKVDLPIADDDQDGAEITGPDSFFKF